MVYTGQDLGLSGSAGDPFGVYPTFNATVTTAAAPGAAPTLVTITDDDSALNVESPNNQLLTAPIDMDGTMIGPAGSSVTILGTSVVINATTGETGLLAIIQINDVDGIAGNNIIIGYATTIEISPGDSLSIFKWKGSPRSVDYDDLIGAPVCFAAGSLVQCPEGWRAIEMLQQGDRVCTATGPRPIMWRAERHVSGLGQLAPVRMATGTLGATAPLFLSPDHRILLSGSIAQLLFNTAQIWVRVADLCNDSSILRQPQRQVAYHHLLLEGGHHTLNVQGVLAESLDPLAASDPTVLASIPAHLLAASYASHPTLSALEARAATAYQGLWKTA